jgi:hypothetical protein
MIQRVIRTYQLPSRRQRLLNAGLIPLAQMAQLLGVSTSTVKTWHHAGLITGHPYNDKGQCLYPPPGPNPPARHKDANSANDAPPTPKTPREPTGNVRPHRYRLRQDDSQQNTPHQPQEVQYATRGFMRGVRTLHSTVRIPASARTASNAVKANPARQSRGRDSRHAHLTTDAAQPEG